MKSSYSKQGIPFTQVANEVLNNPEMSLSSKGMFAYLFSKPDQWQFSSERIQLEHTDGKRAVLSAIRELEHHGYLTRKRLSNGRVLYFLKHSQSAPDALGDESQSAPEAQSENAQGESAPVSNKDIKVINKSSNKEKSQKFSEDDLRLVDLLIELIVRNNPDWQMKGSRETWATHIEKLHRIDGRTYEQIAWMIKWTQNDSFWAQNILSTAKLREKFNDLIPKAKASVGKMIAKQQQESKPKMIL